MKGLEWTPEVDPAITQACGAFLAQIKAQMAVDGVAVVLLEQDKSSGRVVFSWEAWDRTGPPTDPHGLNEPPTAAPPACISLKGRSGIVGAVLIRGTPFASLGSAAVDLAQKPAQHLAVLMENILLQHRLERTAQERAALDQIGEIVRSQAPVEQVYHRFADELMGLIDFQRFSVFLANRKSDLLTLVYRSGPGLKFEELPVTWALPGTGCELVVSACQSCIVDDLRECSDPGWPELSGDLGFRSAVIVPVAHGGDAVGTVVLENRLPRAYGPSDEHALLRTAGLLGPTISNFSSSSQSINASEQSAAFNLLAQILASNWRLGDVFDDFAVAAGTLIEFDRMTLAWLDPNGCDIFTLNFCPNVSVSPKSSEADFVTNIRSKLQFGQHDIGTLALWRRGDKTFTSEDVAILERLGNQVSATVQYQRLYRLAQQQACQLGQLQQSATSAGKIDGVGAPVDRMSEPISRPQGDRVPQPSVSGRQLESLSQELLVNAAHALRSPLSSIKGYSSTLLQPDVSWSAEVRQEFLETIDREADQLTGAINDLLGSMELESGKISLNRQPVPVQNLLWMAQAEVVADYGIQIWFQCEPDLPPVMVDQTRMAQVILNLASSARCVASSKAGLVVNARRTDQRIRITIGLSRGQTNVGDELELSRGHSESWGGLSASWVHEELMLSVCQTVLLAHGVELRQGRTRLQEDIFWFDLPVAEPLHHIGTSSI